MNYELKLTENEFDMVGWMTARGYFPEETWVEMYSDAAEETWVTNPKAEVTFFIPESATWALTLHREEDSYSLFACVAVPLLDKLVALENSIV